MSVICYVLVGSYKVIDGRQDCMSSRAVHHFYIPGFILLQKAISKNISFHEIRMELFNERGKQSRT